MKKETKHIAICIATFKRQEMLTSLLDSLRKIDVPEHVDVSIRVIDNDFQASSRAVVTTFLKSLHGFESIKYVVQPERNIALTRNAALDIGSADLIVFVDDDEMVEPKWLVSLINAKEDYMADAVFGAVEGILPINSRHWVKSCGLFNKNVPKTGTTLTWKETRTSNTLVDGKWFYGLVSLRFDPQFGRSGGSDTELFARMQKLGAKLVSCQESIVSEFVPENRATLSWLVCRFYRNGLIYERIVRSVRGEIHPFARAVKRFGGGLLLMSKSLLEGFESKAFLSGFLRLPLAIGGLVSWLIPDFARYHDAYAPRSERALKRVAFLTNIVSPYRKPVFENLAKTSGWKFRVFVDAKNEFDRSWKVDSKVLSIKKNLTWSFRRKVVSKSPIPFTQLITLHIPVGLFFNLLVFRPAVVISHELGIRTLIAVCYSKLFRKELVIWAYQSRVSSLQGGWRLGFRKFLLSKADKVVGMGKQARAVLQSWGVPSYRIVDAPNAADHRTLEHSLRDAVAAKEINNICREYGDGRKIALVAGRLVPLKGITHLLSCWSRLPDHLVDQWSLVFVGDGPLKAMINKSNARNVLSVGHVPSNTIAYWYAAADLHIFASNGDVWGLAVNEASICGTPTLCSVHAGCYDDLIQNGGNGLKIDFSNSINSLTELKSALLCRDLPKLGQQAKKDIKRYTVDRLSTSFRKAVNAVSAS